MTVSPGTGNLWCELSELRLVFSSAMEGVVGAGEARGVDKMVVSALGLVVTSN